MMYLSKWMVPVGAVAAVGLGLAVRGEAASVVVPAGDERPVPV
jgi:hypothetical protein